MQCLVPWLNELPDPGVIKSELTGVMTALNQDLSPALGALLNDTVDLATAVPKISADVSTMQGAPAFVTEYNSQAKAFNSAVEGLNQDQGQPGEAAQVAALVAALANPKLTNKAAGCDALKEAFQGYKATKSSDLLANTSTHIATLQTVADNVLQRLVPKVSADLLKVDSGYVTAAPCMTALLLRIQRIDDTVLQLPASIETSATLLIDAKDALDKVILVDVLTRPRTLSAILDNLVATSQLPPSLTTAAAELASMQGILDSAPSPDDFITFFDELSTATTDGNIALSACRSSIMDYKSGPDSGTGLKYTDMLTACRGYRSPYMLGVVTATDSPPSNSDLQTAASDIKIALTSLPDFTVVSGEINATKNSVDLIPDFTPYLSALDPAAEAYAGLPSPKSKVLVDARATIEDVVGTITSGLNDAESQIDSAIESIQKPLQNARQETVGKVTEYEYKYRPMADKYNKWRVWGMYGFYGVIILASVMAVIAVLLQCPWLASFATGLLLFPLFLYGIIVLIGTAILKVGSDGCQNMEQQIRQILAEQMDADQAAKFLPLLNYYLTGAGGSLTAVVKTALDVDINKAVENLDSASSDLIGDVIGDYVLRTGPLDIINTITAIITSLKARVNTGLEILQYNQVHPLYVSVKGLVCCRVMNLFGNLWFAVWLAAIFAVALALALFVFIYLMDRLPSAGWCPIRREAEFGTDGYHKRVKMPHIHQAPSHAKMHAKKGGDYSPDSTGGSLIGSTFAVGAAPRDLERTGSVDSATSDRPLLLTQEAGGTPRSAHHRALEMSNLGNSSSLAANEFPSLETGSGAEEEDFVNEDERRLFSAPQLFAPPPTMIKGKKLPQRNSGDGGEGSYMYQPAHGNRHDYYPDRHTKPSEQNYYGY